MLQNAPIELHHFKKFLLGHAHEPSSKRVAISTRAARHLTACNLPRPPKSWALPLANPALAHMPYAICTVSLTTPLVLPLYFFQ